MMYPASRGQDRLYLARRFFGLVPVIIFFLTLIMFAGPIDQSPAYFLQMVLRAMVASVAASFVSVAAYGFYRYLMQRSYGL